jgi:hypothetical protein
VGAGVLRMTMHWHILQALSPSFWRNERSQCYPTRPTPLIYCQLPFFVSKIKNCNEKNKIQSCFMDPADCDERTEGDTGRSVFLGIQFVV